MAGSNIPLLNHYKREFVSKRLPQTFLGGLSLKLGYSVPWYIYLFRILLWLMPWIIGGAFTLAVETSDLSPLHACIGNGLSMGVCVLLLQIASKVVSKKSSDGEKQEASTDASANPKNMRRLLAEEDEEFFESCWSSHTFLFIVPPNRYTIEIIIKSLLSAFICGLGLWYSLVYSTLQVRYNFTIGGSISLYIFIWITISVAHFPLIIGTPVPETAAYRSVDLYGTQNMWRALDVSIFLCIFLAELTVVNPSLNTINYVLHIVFCTLPMLWWLGIFPPFDALLLWAMEQFLIFILGGSSMSTDWRLLFMTAVSSGCLIGFSFISSQQALLACSVVIGHILSTDVTSICMHLLSKLYRFVRGLFCGSKSPVEGYDEGSHGNSPKLLFSWKHLLWHFITFDVLFAATYLCLYFSSSFTTQSKFGMEYAFICMFAGMVLLNDLQRVYVFFGIFRNAMYPLSTLSQETFQKRKRYLKLFGVVNTLVLRLVFSVLSSVYMSAFMFQTNVTLPSFVGAIGTMHALRFVWQRPGNALCCFALLSILNQITSLSSSWWGSLFMGSQLIILDICRDRFFQFVENVWFAVSLLITSWTDKKQRRSSTVLILVMNIIFFPVTLLSIALASLLSAPLLPLFTLPVFLIGFPRPYKFWPSQPGSVQANTCPDTMYYNQLVKPVSNWIAGQIGLGVFGAQFSCSTLNPFYILRTQDRTLWIQVLEYGSGYVSFSLKGLELQETSCHALEATRLDDSFDIAFEKTELDLRCLRLLKAWDFFVA